VVSNEDSKHMFNYLRGNKKVSKIVFFLFTHKGIAGGNKIIFLLQKLIYRWKFHQ
jgi:hypothetical protein